MTSAALKLMTLGVLPRETETTFFRYTLPEGVPLNMSTVVPIQLSSQFPNETMENIKDSRQSLNIPI